MNVFVLCKSGLLKYISLLPVIFLNDFALLTDEGEVSVVSLNEPLSFDSDVELTDKELSDFVSSDSSDSSRRRFP